MKKSVLKFFSALVVLLACMMLIISNSFAEEGLAIRFSKFKNLYPEYSSYDGPLAYEQCKGYVKDFFSSVYSFNVPSTADNKYSFEASSLIQHGQVVYNGNTISASDVQRAISGAPSHSIIQMNLKSGEHTAIITNVEDTYVQLWDANWTGDNIVLGHDMSFEELANNISFSGGGFTVYKMP